MKFSKSVKSLQFRIVQGSVNPNITFHGYINNHKSPPRFEKTSAGICDNPANTGGGPFKQTGQVATSQVATCPALFVLSLQQPLSPGTGVTSAAQDWRQE